MRLAQPGFRGAVTTDLQAKPNFSLAMKRDKKSGATTVFRKNALPRSATLFRQDERLRLLTVKEMADHFRVHPNTVYRYIRERQLPALKLGGEWRFAAESVESWLRSKRGEDD